MLSSPHAARFERWLGRDKIEHLSDSMRSWYGPPIAVMGVPGKVWAIKGGDFIGEVREGFECTAFDRLEAVIKRIRRGARIASSPKRAVLHAGFASLSDLISEATAGKIQRHPFYKQGSTGVVGVTNSLWRKGAHPAAGAAGSAAPGGRAPTSATTGALAGLINPTSPDTLSIVSARVRASVAPNELLLYDRIFDVAKTMNSTATEAVTGVPTRYQSITAGDPDYAGGNFLFVEVGGTALAATAHNWTTCTYTDQSGAGSTLPSLTGNASAIVDRLDHPTSQWFAPLASGDSGIKALTQMQCSALVATGEINFVIGHPIAFMPCDVAFQAARHDYINTAFEMTRIFSDAALAFLEICKSATTATDYSGDIVAVAG